MDDSKLKRIHQQIISTSFVFPNIQTTVLMMESNDKYFRQWNSLSQMAATMDMFSMLARIK